LFLHKEKLNWLWPIGDKDALEQTGIEHAFPQAEFLCDDVRRLRPLNWLRGDVRGAQGEIPRGEIIEPIGLKTMGIDGARTRIRIIGEGAGQRAVDCCRTVQIPDDEPRGCGSWSGGDWSSRISRPTTAREEQQTAAYG